MPLQCLNSELPGVVRFEPDVFKDDRGFFLETFHQKKYADKGLTHKFVQDNHSHSFRGVLRGLHYQLKHPQGKLIYVVNGEIFDVVVDIRQGSSFFGRWSGLILSAENKRQLFVPEGFAHGFLVLSKTADVIYKCTDFYAPDDEYGIYWADPMLNIRWPITDPILSGKDSTYPNLADIPKENLPIRKK